MRATFAKTRAPSEQEKGGAQGNPHRDIFGKEGSQQGILVRMNHMHSRLMRKRVRYRSVPAPC
jgi:hypothetical protein